MNNIVYLTTSLVEEDYLFLCEHTSRKPNPSNQNFHYKYIQAVSKFADNLTVISLVPNKEKILTKSENIISSSFKYKYVYPGNKIYNSLSLSNKIFKEVKGLNPDIVIYDSLNLTLAKVASKLSRANIKTLAMLTDDPNNISNAPSYYKKKVISYSSKAYCYLALTSKLNEIYNKNYRPYLIKEGIVETIEKPAKLHQKPYIYYGGALFIKDGTKDLIDAYLESKPNYDLVISGHGNYVNEVKEAANKNPSIKFLGQVSKQDNYAYEAHAALVINPRIYNACLDEVSIPSKVVEALSISDFVASSLSTPLKEKFDKSINEISSSTNPTLDFFKNHLDEHGNLINLKKNESKKDVISMYGIDAISASLKEFLETIISKH